MNLAEKSGGRFSRILLGSVSLGHAIKLFGQTRGPDDAGAAAAGAAGCALCGTFLLIPIALFVSGIALLVWVAKDAKARGMDNSVVWMIVVMFTHVLGLIVYLYSRPKGDLVECASCRNKRLQVGAKCPHCGNA